MRTSPSSVRLRMKFRRILSQYGGRIAFYIILVVSVLVLSVWLFPPLKYYVTDMFRVRAVQFQNVYYNNTVELDEVTRPFLGTTFWTLDREGLGEALKSVAWVEDVQVSSLPGQTLTVVINEKQPVAIYRDTDGALWIVDGSGTRIAGFTPEFSYRNFPLISCPEEHLGFVVRKIERLTGRYGTLFLTRLSEVVVADVNRKWACYLRDVPWTVYVDPFGTFRNVDRFLRVEKFIRARYDSIGYVDLSFQDQIIVRPN